MWSMVSELQGRADADALQLRHLYQVIVHAYTSSVKARVASGTGPRAAVATGRWQASGTGPRAA